MPKFMFNVSIKLEDETRKGRVVLSAKLLIVGKYTLVTVTGITSAFVI